MASKLTPLFGAWHVFNNQGAVSSEIQQGLAFSFGFHENGKGDKIYKIICHFTIDIRCKK